MTRIDLITLSLFVAVAEETSLAKAAERERLAASAISKRLADLELNFNVKLFDRKPNGMFLTSAGSALLHHARLIRRNVGELEAELQDFSAGVRGTIRLHANATAMARYLPEDLKSFLAIYPEVRVELEESTTIETLRAIADNAADIGIYGDVIVPTDLTSFVYRADRLALLIPFDHPLATRDCITFEDTIEYDYIGAPKGSSIDTALVRASSDLGVSLRMSTRTSGFDAISRMVAARLGIAVVPHSVATSYAETLNVKVLTLEERWAERKLMICVRSVDSLTPAAAAFLAHLDRR
ncbi:LysR family transcriptional regulator [Rhizobium laguerreae]|uniref:LysR family transcriptional regulator n=1 Tax=Rhizobium laguerreae TaxID=1076926 RepID=UPI001C90E941|nr:LysR family transcriptional regulator [Rhizobium laguerreae]MBY3307588.1 LysR family transcriptional regulator [Rhizobium laguerreae]